MTDTTLSEEGKLVADDGVSTIPTPVDGEGGKIKKRKGDVSKDVDPTADKLPEPPVTEGKEEDEDKEVVKGDKPEDEDGKEEIKEGSAILKVFEGVELSEETKHKIAVIFEAAVIAEVSSIVEAKVAEEVDALKEAHSAELDALKEANEQALLKIEENLEGFAKDAQSKWLEENKIAIQDSKTVELAEAFVNSLKDLFVEHAIELDTDSAALIGALEEEVKEANKKTNEAILESIAIKKQLETVKADLVFAEVTEGLTTSQAEKLRDLSTKLVMEDVAVYKADLLSIKESFFPATQVAVTESAVDPVAIVEESHTQATLSEDFLVNQLIQAINNRKNS